MCLRERVHLYIIIAIGLVIIGSVTLKAPVEVIVIWTLIESLLLETWRVS